MSNDRTYFWRGEGCSRCKVEGGIDRPKHVAAATHYGLCSRHFLGATAEQRAVARAAWDADVAAGDEFASPAYWLPTFTAEQAALDALFNLPDAEGWAA
jgi:hypothetical protein